MPSLIKLYDTLSREIRPVVPLIPGAINLYVCGLTVSGSAHIGHGRALVVYDMFVRYLRSSGWKVKYVRNLTDVDDKIIVNALAIGQDPIDFADDQVRQFHFDMEKLGLAKPDHEPRVTCSIEPIVELIEILVQKGHAYARNGNVWFRTASFSEYGKLSGRNLEDALDDQVHPDKDTASDFALWKSAGFDETGWDSPWGRGRPGWHIECSAMIQKSFGEAIDIHGGGRDLIFPHHENEIAQSEAAYGHQLAGHWMHCGLLEMADGKKMGKSLGNAISLCAILDRYTPEAVRLYYAQSSYRSNLHWSETSLMDSQKALDRLYRGKAKASEFQGSLSFEDLADKYPEIVPPLLQSLESFQPDYFEKLAADFDTQSAISLMFNIVRQSNRLAKQKGAKQVCGKIGERVLEAFQVLDRTLGFCGKTGHEYENEIKAIISLRLGISAAEVEDLIDKRNVLRNAKDWAAADEVRDQLAARHIELLDGFGQTEWRFNLETALTV